MSTAFADAQRTNFTIENQFPRWEQLEVGATYEGREIDEKEFLVNDTSTASIYLRYGILDNLAVKLDVPYETIDFPGGRSESGLGDLEVEFQLRTYEDIFGYPYFIPHVSFTVPTGDEDKGLGADGTVVTLGMAFGSTINDWIHWVLDVSYITHPDTDDYLKVGHSYVWSISDEFALVTELLYQEAVIEGVDSELLITGGFTYDWTESIQMDLSVGGGLTGPTDIYGQAKLSYSF
ncbi:MAG: transporter [Kiritimatiellia bacterium]